MEQVVREEESGGSDRKEGGANEGDRDTIWYNALYIENMNVCKFWTLETRDVFIFTVTLVVGMSRTSTFNS